MDTDIVLETRELAVEPSAEAVIRPPGGGLRDYLELTKPRITSLVLVTAAAGFYLGTPGTLDIVRFLNAMLGIALVAGGTSAMNQVLERDVDALMKRTRHRPVPAGRLRPLPAAVFSGALAGIGIAYLALAVNPLTAFLAAVSFATYDFLYTPLKRVHSLSTVIGAVPGALPILGGFTAASGALGAAGWALFGILFLWQLPHFLALAWLLRDDYRAAGLRMLSVADRDGFQTRHQTLVYTLALLPTGLLPTALGTTGPLYFGAATLLGLGFVWKAAAFSRRLTNDTARGLFRYSILYLPALLLVLVLDKV